MLILVHHPMILVLLALTHVFIVIYYVYVLCFVTRLTSHSSEYDGDDDESCE